jgi:lysophospholipase L1-like esterase
MASSNFNSLTDDRFRVTCIGHSFVARLQTFTNQSLPTNKFANCKLDTTLFQISYIAKSGALIKGRSSLHSEVHRLHSLSPHMVFLQLGSNDLCNENCEPITLATDIISFARFLRIGYDITYVIIGTILPRMSAGRFQFDVAAYNRRVNATNQHLHHLASDEAGIHTWKHRGFSNWAQSPFAFDGVHLNHTYGMPKYVRSVRQAMLFYKGKSLR